MSKVIKVDIGAGNISKAIDELRAYREHLMSKINDFVDALIAEGMQVAKARLASTQGDSTNAGVDSIYISTSGDVTKAVIYLEGTDALFIEFGAGIAYNTAMQHPLAGEFGYGPGTYPSKHPPNRAINPGYWYYGGGLKSIGTEATMPIYGAAEHIRNIVVQKANEILRS
jgi:hypothetical protein